MRSTDNTFVEVVHDGKIMKSMDNGFSFSNVEDPGYHLTGVGFGNNTFMVVGSSGGI